MSRVECVGVANFQEGPGGGYHEGENGWKEITQMKKSDKNT